MSDNPNTENDPKHQERDNPNFSPGAGCIIVCMIVALFTGVAAYAIYSGVKQDKDIVSFTQDTPLDLPDEAGSADEAIAVREKMETFKSTMRRKEPATLELSVREINILIHNSDATIDIRDMIYIDSITPEVITGRTSWPLNRLAFWKGRRYLNGTITMAIEASPGRLFLRLKNIESPGKNIPEGFIERISQDDLLDVYKNDDNEDLFDSIQSAEMTDGSVIITSKPVDLPIAD